MRKKIAASELLWLLSLIIYMLIIFYMVDSKKIYALFHPRIFIFMIMEVSFLVLLIYLQFQHVFIYKSERDLNISVVIFFMPVLLFFAVVNNGRDDMVGLINRNNRFIPPGRGNETEKHNEQEVIPDFLVLDEYNYYREYNKIYDNIEKYTGVKIQTDGYIYREDSFTETRFVIANDLMWCCAADMAVIGFYCDYENAPDLVTDKWYAITGTLEKSLYMNPAAGKETEYPVIRVIQYREIPRPDFRIIYPY
jgi:putative membrane protein